MSLALLLAVVAATGSAPAEDVAGDRAAALRCDIAWAYIEGLLRQPGRRSSVFSTEPLQPFIPGGYPRDWGSADGESAASPAPPGLARTLPIGSNAVRSCPSIQQSLTRLHLRFGERATAWASHVRPWRRFRARIETISLPTVSADGDHAVLLAFNTRGGLDAGEVWVHMERPSDGSWRATGLSSLWVS